MTRAIFYSHQTNGAFAGVCACDRTHQMEKTAMGNICLFLGERLSTFFTDYQCTYFKAYNHLFSCSLTYFIYDILEVKLNHFSNFFVVSF